MLEENVYLKNKSLFLLSELHLVALFTANSCQYGLDDFSFICPCSSFHLVYSCCSGELTKYRRACVNDFGISYWSSAICSSGVSRVKKILCLKLHGIKPSWYFKSCFFPQFPMMSFAHCSITSKVLLDLLVPWPRPAPLEAEGEERRCHSVFVPQS